LINLYNHTPEKSYPQRQLSLHFLTKPIALKKKKQKVTKHKAIRKNQMLCF